MRHLRLLDHISGDIHIDTHRAGVAELGWRIQAVRNPKAVAHLRAEAVTEAQASDVRLSGLIDEVSRTIDRVTGWFFEPRWMTFRLDGRGAPSIEPPASTICLDRLAIGDSELSLDPEDLGVVG